MAKKWRNKNVREAFKNAINGIKYVFKNEHNYRIQVVFSIIAISIGIILEISFLEFAIIFTVIALVFLAEFINSIVETVVDMYTEEYNEKAKIAKDVAAGTAMLMAIASVIVGILIYLPKILKIFNII